ncbi:hypothetical protein [Flavobacterium rivuli]|uniref:hypothetical protein n=1 Tax=Flavobacterium rivuli TaxID=498301 RepID=UPI0003782B9C|nr:hypothetical protein [Flavobacterium rivuli]
MAATNKTAHKLTKNHKNFCLAYIRLQDESAAYVEAYNVSAMKPESITKKAKELLNADYIKAHIAKLQGEDTGKGAAGRPLKYNEAFNMHAHKLCLLGATDAELADFFEVNESTINKWKIDFPLFSESIKNGKKVADMEVAFSMYQSTQDREITELKAIKCKEVSYDENGKRIEIERVQLAPETRVIPGDYRSQSLWLRNRSSDNWRDRQEIDHTTKGETVNNISLGTGVKPPEE